MKKEYVVGFAFDSNRKWVMLIGKNRPKWQEGFLNGVGGKVEKDESSLQAMIREFKEETGVSIKEWTLICVLEFEDSKIWYFSTFSSELHNCYSITDETVTSYSVLHFREFKVIPNLKWLIPLALDGEAPRPMVNELSGGINKYVEGMV